MRKRIRQVFALMLAVVMCVTVLPAVPAKAAKPVTTLFSGGISSDRVNATGAAYYWKGDEVKLSVKAADNATVEWTTTDEDGNIALGPDVISGGSSGGYITHNSDLTIADSATGSYLIKATATSGDTYQEVTYNILVQEKDFVVLEYGKNSNEKIYTSTAGFNSVILVNARCTDVRLEQVEVTTDNENLDDESKDVITDNPVSILGIGSPQKNTAKYPGCVEYQYPISSPAAITSDISKIALRLVTTKNSMTSTGLVAKYWILESATKVSNFKVTSSNQPDNQDLEKYPHIANQIIYMDSNETIKVEGTVEGSATDLPRLALINAKNNFKTVLYDYTPDVVNKKIDFIITLEGMSNKEVDNESLKITTLSGISNEYKVKVYNVDRWDLSEITTDGSGGGAGFAGYQYSKYDLKVTYLDSREEIEWSSSSTNTATVTSTGLQTARLDAHEGGSPKITAQLKPTPASSRASMVRTIIASISRVTDPEEFKIDFSTLESTNYKLPQGGTAQISAVAYAEGNPYSYPPDYFKWKSSDSEVATIDSTGKITAKNPGNTTISVRDIKDRDIPQNRQTVTVYAPVKKITLKQMAYETANPKDIATHSYAAGQSCMLYAETTPNIAGVEEIEWKSSDTSIAAIESHPSNNKIKYIKFAGTGSVTITANGEFNTSVKDTVTFTVNPSVPAQNIKVSGGETVIKEKVWLPKDGSATTLTAVQTDVNGSTANDVLTWYCEPSNQSVVMLSQDVNGTTADIKAIGTGEVKVYARNAAGVKSTPIVVKGVIYATSVGVTSESGKRVVGYGNTLKLKPTVSLGSTELTDLNWSSSDTTKIDLVRDSDGKVIVGSDGSVEVKGINYTEANIRITATNNSASLPRSGYIDLKVVNSIQDNCTVESIPDVVYTSQSITPELVIKNTAGEELILNVHYRVSYKDNTNAGVATITITGVEGAGYVDTTTVTFNILPATLNADNATIADYTSKITYDGKEKEITPNVKVKINGQERNLSREREYEFVYANNVNAGTMTITAKGIGNYTGSISKTFTIEPKAVSYISVTLEKTSFEYEAGAITPKVTVKDASTELKVGKDYNISYSNNTDVTSGSDRPAVTITGLGNYTGEKVTNFTISTRNITNLDDAYLKTTDYIYNGKAKKPKVVLAFIREDGTRVSLKAKRDYDLTYTNNVEKGIARATITGKGNYSGSLSLEFGIAEKVKVSRATIRSVKNSKKKRTVVTIKKVSGAVGYEVAYSLKKKFPKNETKVKTTKKTTYTIKNLKKGKKYYFRVRAYKVNSIGRKVFGSWSKVKYVKVKR